MADFDQAIYDAVYDALEADSVLMGIIKSIYDNVPQPDDSGDDADFPYIVLGDNLALEWDTDDSSGKDVSITVNSWSRQRGRQETRQIQDAIYNVLHRADLVVSGFNFVTMEFVNSSTARSADGKTYQGISEFRMLINDD